MKILEPGMIEHQKPLRFRCGNCGCLFEAGTGEYSPPKRYDEFRDGIEGTARCPCCDEVVVAKKGEQENR